jgi:hypothetical protein
MPICSICKKIKKKDEMDKDICLDCADAIVKENDTDVGMDDFS